MLRNIEDIIKRKPSNGNSQQLKIPPEPAVHPTLHSPKLYNRFWMAFFIHNIPTWLWHKLKGLKCIYLETAGQTTAPVCVCVRVCVCVCVCVCVYVHVSVCVQVSVQREWAAAEKPCVVRWSPHSTAVNTHTQTHHMCVCVCYGHAPAGE